MGDYDVEIPCDTESGEYKVRVARFEDQTLFGCSGAFEIVGDGSSSDSGSSDSVGGSPSDDSSSEGGNGGSSDSSSDDMSMSYSF